MHKLFEYIAAFVLRKYIIQFVLFFITALLSLSIYFFIVEKKRAKQELQAQAQMLELKNEISLQQVYLQLAGAASFGYAVWGDKATAAGLDMALDSIQPSTLRLHSLCKPEKYKAGSDLCAWWVVLVMQKDGNYQLVKRMYDFNSHLTALKRIVEKHGGRVFAQSVVKTVIAFFYPAQYSIKVLQSDAEILLKQEGKHDRFFLFQSPSICIFGNMNNKKNYLAGLASLGEKQWGYGNQPTNKGCEKNIYRPLKTYPVLNKKAIQ